MARPVSFGVLTSEVGKWSVEQFGKDELPLERLSGASEEVGELSEAFWRGNEAEIKDSIGDIIIYLADYVYREGLDVEGHIKEFEVDDTLAPPESSTQVVIELGNLHRAQLKGRQDIRQDENRTGKEAKERFVKSLLGCLNQVCKRAGYDFNEVVRDTADEVLDREW